MVLIKYWIRSSPELDDEQIACVTSGNNRTGNHAVSVWFGRAERHLQDIFYHYTPDPNITSAAPSKSFLRYINAPRFLRNQFIRKYTKLIKKGDGFFLIKFDFSNISRIQSDVRIGSHSYIVQYFITSMHQRIYGNLDATGNSQSVSYLFLTVSRPPEVITQEAGM